MSLPAPRLAILSMALLAACARSTHVPGRVTEPEGHRVRVMTYNIAAGRFGLDAVAAAIRDERPDVVGLQEVDVHFADRSAFADQARRLAEALDMEVFFAPIYTLPPLAPGGASRKFGVAVLSRLPIEAARNRQITRLSTQEPNPSPREMPGLADVRLRLDDVRLRVLDTHLDYRSDPAVRRLQVADLLAALGPIDSLPTIVLGDMNAPPDAPELRPLLERLTDAWTASGDRGDGFTFPAPAPDRRIDYVLVGAGIEVGAARVPDTRASDHRPVTADLVVR